MEVAFFCYVDMKGHVTLILIGFPSEESEWKWRMNALLGSMR